MKYVVLALLMLVLGALLTTFKPAEPLLIPVVRLRSPEGFFVTYVHDRIRGRKRCEAEIDLYIDPLQAACPACSIESTDCTTQLTGMEKALAENQPLPVHVVRSKGLRMSVVGPPRWVRVLCEAVARQMVLSGAKTAACVHPQGAS